MTDEMSVARPELETAETNAPNLSYGLGFIRKLIQLRCDYHFNGLEEVERGALPQLAYYGDGSAFSKFIEERQPTLDEYVVLLLALMPHIAPDSLEHWIKEGISESGGYPQFGGAREGDARVLVPTGETAAFLLAGYDLERRFEIQRLFTSDHWFSKEGVLRLEESRPGDPCLSGRLLLSQDAIELFTLGSVSSPAFSASFPAREVRTQLQWDDLILNDAVREQIDELKHWVQHNEALLSEWGMRRKIRPGYRALFYGPSGTGKTLTAALLGKYTGRSVFRIDLSTVVSKYIGETEKNLANLFDRARSRDWILFFDEADALFGKRTAVKDAHDRYANQEVSYLLQAVEEFDGLVILASNFKANLDEAFLRRFNAIIKFPPPNEAERTEIWRKSLPRSAAFEDNLDLPVLLAKFELTGGNIINAVQHACIAAIARGSGVIRLDDAVKGIQREIEKEGKIFDNVLRDSMRQSA